MSYEGEMLKEYSMPIKKDVEKAILITLFKHNGTIKEFANREEIVNEIADNFSLNDKQRTAVLERIYQKENRIVKSPLWHRLLFRAADTLAKEKLVTRPTSTILLTNKKEWMLTEKGIDRALEFLQIPKIQKEFLPTKTFEVQKVVKKIKETPRPENYNPFEKEKKIKTISKEMAIRSRGFRQAVIESYDCRCAICGLKINSPNTLLWEVEAAHIVPHNLNGKDDIWNGIALCRLHHWAFDVGWFSLSDNYEIINSPQTKNIPDDYGKLEDYNFLNYSQNKKNKILLPNQISVYPHQASIQWHRENIFHI